jgi:hypothetical protein
VIGRFGRWVIDLCVLCFAGYAFAFVPLGERTGLEHTRAILRSEPARQAADEVIEAGERLRHRLFDDDPLRVRGTPNVLEIAPAQSKLRAADAGADASL